MPFSTTRLLAAVLAGCILIPDAVFAQTPAAKKPASPPAHAPAAPAAPAQTPAPAQDAAPGQQPQGGPVKADLVPSQATWTKVCGKDPTGKEVCYTTRDFGVQADQAPILAVAVYDLKGEDTRVVRLLLPIGLMLRPGFRFQVDKGAPIDGAYDICIPNGCFAEIKVKSPTVDAMKKGTTLIVSVKNQAGNEVDFNIPLGNFGEAFDGAAVDPKVLEEQQKKFQEELQKRAEEERKRLEAQQPAAGAAPAGGAAAPAPAPAGK